MARSPFQGLYQPGVRPTVVTAPDALVFINGETDLLGCGKCRRRFEWGKYITSIQVDLNVDSAPGSASINMSVPRHTIDEFYFDGSLLISPMMEVEIFAKGYYLVEGMPQYYPIFWGMTTEISESYSGGEHSFSINCADILKWWELCKMNINPAFTHTKGSQGWNIFGNVFFGTNPYDIIWTLAQQSFGDVVVGSGSLTSMFKESGQKQTFAVALADMMRYWNERFSRMRSRLLLYGTSGTAVRGDMLDDWYPANKMALHKDVKNPRRVASQTVRAANGGAAGSQMVFDPTDPNVVAFRKQFMNAGQINFWTSEYQTKLELANAAKECIGFEFFMDVTGDIVFKPPFYNLDVLSNKPVSWIQDIDIIDWDLSESEAEVVTQLQIGGNFGGNTDYGFPDFATPFTSVTDYNLLRKYGWRTQTINSEFMASPYLMFYMGLDTIDRMNSKRFRGTVNIPLRPELRLGFPVYLAPKDQIWYLTGISHNIQFGSRAQSTLTLSSKRSKFIAPKGIGTIELQPKTSGAPKKQASPKKGAGKKKSTTGPIPKRGLTSKQLKTRTFKVKVGDAAQIPAVNAPTKPNENNPYEPLLLRHPKTGRIVGYPNVVLAYTRPFYAPPDALPDLHKISGQRTAKSKRKKVPGRSKQHPQGQEISDMNLVASAASSEVDDRREKYITNRYAYGLNSAGVYTYLHDISKAEPDDSQVTKTGVIKEILVLPASNISYSGGAKLNTRSAMIQPVSDERGFEVIGHFKYGRGVALRDGSLVLQHPGSANSRANVETQIALAGDLYGTLQAQSAGLSTIITSYPNPADAVAKLQPEDLQTAGIINPDSKPTFVTGKENYINVAPLHSPQQEGVPVNVEASQLSRALTLAEMGDPGENAKIEACDCLMGRPDLAFINMGYSLKVLAATASGVEESTFSTGLDPTRPYIDVSGAGEVETGYASGKPGQLEEEQEEQYFGDDIGAGEEELRNTLVSIARSVIGLSAGRNPSGYLDLIMGPNDPPGLKTWFLDPATSSCTLTCRGIWRRAGLREAELINETRVAAATNDLTAIAGRFGAWILPHETGTFPKPGDVVITGGGGVKGGRTEHGYTVLTVTPGEKTCELTGVDGGLTDTANKFDEETSQQMKTMLTLEANFVKAGADFLKTKAAVDADPENDRLGHAHQKARKALHEAAKARKAYASKYKGEKPGARAARLKGKYGSTAIGGPHARRWAKKFGSRGVFWEGGTNVRGYIDVSKIKTFPQLTGAVEPEPEPPPPPIVEEPVEEKQTLSRESVVTRVEDFLTNLYITLDGVHQEYEKAIRGDIIAAKGGPDAAPEEIRFGKPEDGTTPGFSPPFDSAGRARGGDPVALAQQASEAIEDIEKAWDTYSEDIKNVAKKKELELKIAEVRKKIAELEKERKRLEEFVASGTKFVSTAGSLETQLQKVNVLIDVLLKGLAGWEQELATL
jgi:hypothetical protein